tara:strand:- start:1169 stop:2098 length:930 start_codon:yes stop_codon:yes gene_type:complete
METYSRYGSLVLGIILTANVTSAKAADNDSPFSASAFAGYEYDSNITVDQIDSNSGLGDDALILEGAIGYAVVDNDDVRLNVGYDFYQSLHDDVTEFDLQIHGFNADTSYSIDDFDLGLMYMFNTIDLGSDPFLDIHSIRPSVGYMIDSKDIYLLASYEYQDQKFDSVSLEGRNAKKNSASVKGIVLMEEGRTFTATYTYSDHNANDDAYSYQGNMAGVSVKIPFDLTDNEAIFRGSYRFYHKNYGIESLIYDDEERTDKRHTFRTSVEVPIIHGFKGKLEYEYINSISTLAALDYNESVFTAGIGWEF